MNPTQPTLNDRAMELHKTLRGKLSIKSKTPIKDRETLSLVYTPGVGAVASAVAKDSALLRTHTIKGNTVAVISDGSAVLGLGNIGPGGALPVMEGKAALFKELADVDAFPICLATQDVDAIVETIVNIAPVFGGINLEDIAAPRCFEIERRLQARLTIPVIHDDQHGTAIVVLAGLFNAFTVVKKDLHQSTIAIIGAGAAGNAVARLLLFAGAGDICLVDRKGIVTTERTDLDPEKMEIARITNHAKRVGTLHDALASADAVVGVSGPGLITADDVRAMNKAAIVIAMANPVPEIMPDEARAGGAAIVATGRSDFPNQVNNALCFPGMFRGALDNNVTHITQDMKLAAARALAAVVKNPTTDYIIPSPFDPAVVAAVANAIR
jgi:malate dehydrogenase (oxaloacetate-decarboxylating)